VTAPATDVPTPPAGESSSATAPATEGSHDDSSGSDKSGSTKPTGTFNGRKGSDDKGSGSSGKSGSDKKSSRQQGPDQQGSDQQGSDQQGSGKSGQGKSGQGKSGQDKSDSSQQGSDKQGSDMNGSGKQDATPAPTTSAPGPDCAPAPAAPATADTSAATKLGWGTPNRVENFDAPLGSSWGVYDGAGHNGNGRRTPAAVSIKDGIMTLTGDSQGDTAGMAWQPGQRYGRWEGRVRAPAGDPSYHAVMLLWPDAENWPVGGEVDFMENSDPGRQTTEMFLHYGKDNQQVQGSVDIDATRWHDWAVEWTPTGVTAYVDGKKWWSTDQVDILPPGPMHLCIQLDNFGGGSLKETTMEVDWVKQYSLSPGAADAGKASEGIADAPGSLVEGVADAAGRVRTEGAPDPVPAVTGLVQSAAPASR